MYFWPPLDRNQTINVNQRTDHLVPHIKLSFMFPKQPLLFSKHSIFSTCRSELKTKQLSYSDYVVIKKSRALESWKKLLITENLWLFCSSFFSWVHKKEFYAHFFSVHGEIFYLKTFYIHFLISPIRNLITFAFSNW